MTKSEIRKSDTAEGKQMIAMMEKAAGWPRWPILPVKRLSGFEPEFGIMLAIKGELRTAVFLANMYALAGFKADSAPKLSYASFAEIIDDGWVID